eukprot:1268929-Alexandrium_andersonii.AAC.1
MLTALQQRGRGRAGAHACSQGARVVARGVCVCAFQWARACLWVLACLRTPCVSLSACACMCECARACPCSRPTPGGGTTGQRKQSLHALTAHCLRRPPGYRLRISIPLGSSHP